MDRQVLQFQRVDAGYRSVPVVRNINVTIAPGEIVTIIGPNGAGKSTILRSAASQLALVAGTVCLDGRRLSSLSRREQAERMAVVLTRRPQTDLLTCFDIVAAGRYPYTGSMGILSERDRAKVREAMELVGLWELRDRDFSETSDGQKQMLSLARAICQEPEILVLDEPTSFLDISRKVKLLSILQALARKEHTAILMSLHELDLAEKVSDRVLCVKNGRIDRAGGPDEIFTAGYIGELYGLEKGHFEPAAGTVELPKPPGESSVFVISGGGTGVRLYRRLQRKGIPFSAGILREGDLDFPAAQALASELFSAPAYDKASAKLLGQAEEAMIRAGRAVCTLSGFGPADPGNEVLLSFAEREGILVPLSFFDEL